MHFHTQSVALKRRDAISASRPSVPETASAEPGLRTPVIVRSSQSGVRSGPSPDSSPESGSQSGVRSSRSGVRSCGPESGAPSPEPVRRLDREGAAVPDPVRSPTEPGSRSRQNSRFSQGLPRTGPGNSGFVQRNPGLGLERIRTGAGEFRTGSGKIAAFSGNGTLVNLTK